MRGQLPTRKGVPGYPIRNIALVNGIRLHYTAGPASATVGDIAAYQVGPGAQEPFPAIAYHLLVDGDGTVNWCHDLDRRVWGSGQPGSNETDVHICYTGTTQPNEAQIRGIRRAIAWTQSKLGGALTVRGHKDGYPTSCPGPLWPSWRDQVVN